MERSGNGPDKRRTSRAARTMRVWAHRFWRDNGRRTVAFLLTVVLGFETLFSGGVSIALAEVLTGGDNTQNEQVIELNGEKAEDSGLEVNTEPATEEEPGTETELGSEVATSEETEPGTGSETETTTPTENEELAGEQGETDATTPMEEPGAGDATRPTVQVALAAGGVAMIAAALAYRRHERREDQ